eukprot:m.356680 g.356680  ORF g.356680 m.356680 type:complete len:1009 (-) comp19932_c3_seq2:259-3285(-)
MDVNLSFLDTLSEAPELPLNFQFTPFHEELNRQTHHLSSAPAASSPNPGTFAYASAEHAVLAYQSAPVTAAPPVSTGDTASAAAPSLGWPGVGHIGGGYASQEYQKAISDQNNYTSSSSRLPQPSSDGLDFASQNDIKPGSKRLLSSVGSRPPSRSRKSSRPGSPVSRVTSAAPSRNTSPVLGRSARHVRQAQAQDIKVIKPGKEPVCALFLETNDDTQCRFAVKNDMKTSNQALAFVQKNGYVEYKARYCKKRGSQGGYGYFHIAFLPATQVIYPFMEVPADMYTQHQIHTDNPFLQRDGLPLEHLNRVEVTVRLYQSFRGTFPIRLIKFGEDETYHSLYINEWQDATLLQGPMDPPLSKMSVELHPHGEYIRYVVEDQSLLSRLGTKDGIKFPCPVPNHPERLNDIGMIRMQVTIRPIFSHHEALASGFNSEYNTWIRLKVVQQLSAKKKPLFANMLRPHSAEWSAPPRPQIVPVAMSPAGVVEHVLGPESLSGDAAVRMLLALGQEIARREKDSHSSTALHLAANQGEIGVAQMLLRTEPTLVHETDTDGSTPLHSAADCGSLPMVKFLVEYGAQTTVCNRHGFTPLTLAQAKGRSSAAAYLQRVSLHEGNCGSLFRAASVGHILCTKTFLRSRHDPNETNTEGLTPLLLAMYHNQPFVVMTLLLGGADPLIVDRQGFTAMHYAAERGLLDVVVFLAQHHPESIDRPGHKGQTPLHRAAAAGMVVAVGILLSCGADPDARDDNGATPAELASRANHPGTCLVLAYHGPGASATLATFAQTRTGGTIFQAARLGDVALVRNLLSTGASLNAVDPQGNTPLKIAAECGNVLVLDELLSRHISSKSTDSIDIVGSDGFTPLHAACRSNSIGCIVVLLTCQACNLSARDNEGNTPLHLSAKLGLPVCSAFLLLAGADPSLKNNARETPAMIASSCNHSGTLQVLLCKEQVLVQVAQTLEKPPPPPVGGARFTMLPDDQVFSWQGFDEILSRIWNSTHAVRNIVASSRPK